MTPRPWSVALALIAALGCGGDPIAPTPIDENGGTWATWVLADGSALRPAAPAPIDAPAVQAELDEVVAVQAQLTPDQRAAIARWDGPPSVVWNQIARTRLGFYWALLPDVRTATPARAARAAALLNLALYDAQVAVWDAKYAFRRPAPSDADHRIEALAPTDGRPGFPSEHAAAAAAAAMVLAYVIPDDDPAGVETEAREAADSRVWAGAALPSDVAAGWAIGEEVARRVIALAGQDGSDRVWTGSAPVGAQYWKPTPPKWTDPPFDPLAGEWRPWVLPSGSAFRPPPPPDYGSARFMTDLDELRSLSTGRTTEEADVARYWATDPPSARWIDFMLEEIARRRPSPVRAARDLALVSVALSDAFIACWDGKFHYWYVRPITADPGLVTVFATPPFPSYPSGHSTVSAAAAEVFAYLFPDAEARYRDEAHRASLSRVWAAVHYRFDIEAGETLGAAVGRAVVERARADGADR